MKKNIIDFSILLITFTSEQQTLSSSNQLWQFFSFSFAMLNIAIIAVDTECIWHHTYTPIQFKISIKETSQIRKKNIIALLFTCIFYITSYEERCMTIIFSLAQKIFSLCNSGTINKTTKQCKCCFIANTMIKCWTNARYPTDEQKMIETEF